MFIVEIVAEDLIEKSHQEKNGIVVQFAIEIGLSPIVQFVSLKYCNNLDQSGDVVKRLS